MAYSQNGYLAKDFSLIATYTIPGTGVRVSIRRGDVSVVLLYFMEQFNKRVEPITGNDNGGYNPRSIVDSNTLSNHASGTAVDLNWNKHVMGKSGTFTSKQRAEIHAILRELDGVIRWGGDYKGRKDEMHFEINASLSKVTAVANKIRARKVGQAVASAATSGATKAGGTLRRGDSSNRVRTLQAGLNHIFPKYSKLKLDGDFGPKTEAVIKEFQRRAGGLAVDGIVGPKTTAALNSYGVRF